MTSFADIIKNGVIYKHLRQPFSIADILHFFATVPLGITSTTDESIIKRNLSQLVSEQKLIKMGAFPFYFFPDMPVSNSAYLATILKSLLIKIKIA